jgi:hypothetical protein
MKNKNLLVYTTTTQFLRSTHTAHILRCHPQPTDEVGIGLIQGTLILSRQQLSPALVPLVHSNGDGFLQRRDRMC